ncbi:hypothetical protein CCAN12_70002 [Capnocytophaga canimorsus]|uniref:Uncharacterized protein n=1 Tax=Capnocytophaga canimorsus TaxID=28188 RepID=A0A0B7HC79_9FLAO|nr:hypothetical protein [Capnocytophaga canimorsus]CEN37291.1 hypothetical protein CCAN12_70002 [Capnocytophaga canimorsus]
MPFLQDSNATTYTLAHLNGGSFYLTLYDANGCDVSTPPVTIAPTLLIDKDKNGVVGFQTGYDSPRNRSVDAR